LEVKKTQTDPLAVRNKARKTFKKESDVKFTGRVLVDPKSKEPVLYTENIFLRFRADVPAKTCEKIIASQKLTIKEKVKYSPNTYFVEAPEGTA